MDERHIIDEAEFDISFDSEAAAREQKTALASFIQERLLPLADEIFSELAGDGRIFRMERLEIDLGDVDYSGFREEMEVRFRRELRSVLAEKLSGISAAPSTTERMLDKWQAGRVRLESFLETGRMPWSADRTTGSGADEMLLSTLRHEGGAFLEFLKRTPHRDIVVKRLSLQFPDRLLADVMRLLAPAHASRLGELVGKLGDGWKRKVIGITDKELKSLIWQQLLGEHLKSAVPDPEQRLSEIVKKLLGLHARPQGRAGKDDADGLSWLSDCLGQERSAGTGRDGDATRAGGPTEGQQEGMIDVAPLRARLELALSEGTYGEIADVWDELRSRHGELVRAVFMQRMGDLKLRERLVAGFPEAMLLELIGILAPMESGFLGAVARLPELQEAGTGSARNEAFWTYTLAYLQAHGPNFERPEYARGLIGLVRHQDSTERALVHSLIAIAPDLEGPLAGQLARRTTEARPGESTRADRLYESLVRRLNGGIDAEPDFGAVIDELAHAYPETLARLLRQLQSGELRADVGALARREARQLVMVLIRLNSAGGGNEFLRAIERQAGTARSKDGYYRHILEKLIRNETIDLEEVAMDAVQETVPIDAQEDKPVREGTDLRALLDRALSNGRADGIDAEWADICRHHAVLVRESFIRRMGSENAQENVSQGFTEAMLRDIVRILAPAESEFIGTLARQPELYPERTHETRSANVHLWKHTLSYLHKVANGGFDRYDYALSLMRHLSDHGVAWMDLAQAVSRADPSLAKVRAEQRDKLRESGYEEGSISLAAHKPSGADELYERLVRRLSGMSAGEHDLLAVIDELAHVYPETLARLQRQLQSGELRAEVGTLAAREVKHLVVSLVRLNSGANGYEFLRSIERHAGMARSEAGYYRGILEALIRNQIIDLEEAALLPGAGASQGPEAVRQDSGIPPGTQPPLSRGDHDLANPRGVESPLDGDEVLRIRLETSLTMGHVEEVEEIWGSLLRRHADMLRDIFLRRLSDEKARSRLATGFSESMLGELVCALIPPEGEFIVMLAGPPELRVGEGGATAAKNIPLWTYTLAYLHASGLSAFERGEYARGLAQCLAEQGVVWTDIRQAIVRTNPALEEVVADPRFFVDEEPPDVSAEATRADELSRLLTRRLSGQERARELAQELIELSAAHPGAVGQLYRQFQSGEARLDVTALAEGEARLHVDTFMSWSLGSAGNDFRREIESHAGKARSCQRYYQIILERLVCNQVVDLDEAMGAVMADVIPERTPSPTGTNESALPVTEQLRARIESALIRGNAETGVRDDLHFNHADIVREVFARRMGKAGLIEKLAEGFPEDMLVDLVRMLAPADSRFVETLACLPELRDRGGEKNATFWGYTLGYLHGRGAQDLDRAGYARGLARHMQEHGASRRLPQAMIDAVPELNGAIADPVEGFGQAMDAEIVPAAGSRADDLYEIAISRLGGQRRGGQDFVEAISELEKTFPAALARFYRKLQSSELRGGIDTLSAPEARQLAVSFARLNAGSRGGEFLRAIEQHAGQAKDLSAYYRNILEKLVRDEIVDLEEAANKIGASHPGDEGKAPVRKIQLRARLDAAMSEGKDAAIAAEWDEICDGHADLLREGFSRWMGSESAREKTIRGFAAFMLEDMVRILAPGESGFIAALAARIERHPGTNRGGNVAVWEYTLGYLYAARDGGFDRASYVAGLMSHLAARGMKREEVSRAIVKASPELDKLASGQPERHAHRAGDGTKPGEESGAAGAAQSDDATPKGEHERADELLQRVSQYLAGKTGTGQDWATDLADLARDYPATFARLVDELRSGRLCADVGALSMGEARQLVVSIAGSIAGAPGREFLRAIEQHAGTAANMAAYYRNVLERLVHDEVIDLEEAACTGSPETAAPSPVRVPEREEAAGKGNVVSTGESGSHVQGAGAARIPQADTRDSGGSASEETMEIGEEIYIANAGMVLLTPYMPQLFRMLDLTEGPKFRDARSAERAIHLLQFAVNESCDSPEFLLALNKILCGVVSGTPIVREIELAANEKETIEGLLGAVIRNWTILGSTSVQGLRESFLQRKGRLQLKEDAWHLKVEQKGIDVLLDRLPWSYSLIRHPWMKLPVYVEWR